ncbi:MULTISPECIES: hypothetical protein [Cohnella]|uniref:hypothetical protein n=1 Tax=Cohnella TaxID=329857 RepID=UPI0009B9DA1F|nr:MULTISPECIES: hypothetical protein [Cohnella]MBN2981601.1 hypothetical protein [Cohnella algarum]
MKLIRNPWKRVALNRLILSFICILLPLYTLAVVIYNWGIRTLQTEISGSMTSQVSHYGTRFRATSCWIYEITSTEIVDKDDTSVIRSMGEEVLVVTACYPFDTPSDRCRSEGAFLVRHA